LLPEPQSFWRDDGWRSLRTIPDSGRQTHPSSKLSPEQLALVETLAIGCHASDRGNPQKDENILVIGAGPIGLSTLEFNRLGDANITVMDMSEERLDFCRKKYGIDSLIQFKGDGSEKEKMLEATNGNLFDLVTDATGNQHSMGGALQYVAHTGRLVYVGITTENISFRTQSCTVPRSPCSPHVTPCPKISPASSN
jgi:alcohol dehydrogenase